MRLRALLGTLLIIVLGGAVLALFAAPLTRPEPGGVACTMEAMQCPDGSYVGRTGPNCEFAACSQVTPGPGGGGGILPYQSGIRGTVMLGPTCPVERMPPDPECADRPYATLIAIFRASDMTHAIVFVRSRDDGTFVASLPPGDYYVGAGESNLPRCEGQGVTVGPNGYTSIIVSCDTGIR